MPHDIRDSVVDYLRSLSERTEIPLTRLLGWAQIQRGRFYDWNKRYGKANEHNGKIPRDHWLETHERDAIIAADTHRV